MHNLYKLRLLNTEFSRIKTLPKLCMLLMIVGGITQLIGGAYALSFWMLFGAFAVFLVESYSIMVEDYQSMMKEALELLEKLHNEIHNQRNSGRCSEAKDQNGNGRTH